MAALSADKYLMLGEVEQILLRPDTLLGSIERMPRMSLCFDQADQTLKMKNVMHPTGQEHLFKEVLGNAADNVSRSREMKIDPGRIEIVHTDQIIAVKNYGTHIPVEVNKQTGMYVPEMIFGHMRTGTNYNDNEVRNTIGRNGVGVKVCNIFSQMFVVECADPINGILYTQVWENHMNARPPTMEKYSGIGYTKVTYLLDFPRFGLPNFDLESQEIYMALAIGIAYTCKIPVIYNDREFNIKKNSEYASYFFELTKGKYFEYISPDKTQEICVVDTPHKGSCYSFVNGIPTKDGGVHVEVLYKLLKDHVTTFMEKSLKGITLTKRDLDSHISIFASFVLDKPKFSTQSKDCLTSPTPKLEIPERLLSGIKNWDLIQRLHEQITIKQGIKLKATDGKRSGRSDIPNAVDANFAVSGGANAADAILILIEGDSAKNYAVSFYSQVPDQKGRDYFGVLPLHGKLINSINANFLKLVANVDLNNIKQMLGLKDNTDYSEQQNFSKLKYGNLLCMMDSDVDGKHILGLVLLFFLSRFWKLVDLGFFKFLRTPIKMTAGHGVTHRFYTEKSYVQWAKQVGDLRGWTHSYFKGLGSYSKDQMPNEFANQKVVTFRVDEAAGENMSLAFHKLEVSKRKEWLINYVEDNMLQMETITDLPISLYVKSELIEYTIENVNRAIPNAIDGLKDAQRKTLFAGIKYLGKNKAGKTRFKVAPMASYVSTKTCYKHGEVSLSETIHNMAQDFVGANNMPYFNPEAMLGTRNEGGKDASDPRYTYVSNVWWHDYIYRKEDLCIQERIEDEGALQECKTFFPILPMHVINGIIGVGTAFSTNIPAHNPMDIAFWFGCRLQQDLLKHQIYSSGGIANGGVQGISLPALKPWYRGFLGEIRREENGFTTHGIIAAGPKNSLVITELPVGMWTVKYEAFLGTLEKDGIIGRYKSYSTEDKVKFILEDPKVALNEKKLKLIMNLSYRNMTVLYYTSTGRVQPKIYTDIHKLLEDFYTIRLANYQRRKDALIRDIDEDIQAMDERRRFISAVAVERILEIRNRDEAELYASMASLNLGTHLLDIVKTRELTRQKVIDLENKIIQKKQEKIDLQNTAPQIMWYKEIEEFVGKYCKHYGAQPSTYATCGTVPVPTAPTGGEAGQTGQALRNSQDIVFTNAPNSATSNPGHVNNFVMSPSTIYQANGVSTNSTANGASTTGFTEHGNQLQQTSLNNFVQSYAQMN